MIDADTYGISFSAKQCHAFTIDPEASLEWLLQKGWRRFRLMSYWDESERIQGQYDFSELDRQLAQISAAGGVVSLCLGARQPRWPENHWPNWAWKCQKKDRSEALLAFITTVVERYKTNSIIISYQLENEALLKSFGLRSEVDRKRLQAEFSLIKRLDPVRPISMSTSTSWGIPVRSPRPDIVGFSFYQVLFGKGKYTTAFHSPFLDRQRAVAIRILFNTPSFVHELQCEPWGPTSIWDMSIAEQNKSMDTNQITRNIQLARQIGVYPIDLWGAEWWYWRYMQSDTSIYDTVTAGLQ
jgi:hypothetical protein